MHHSCESFAKKRQKKREKKHCTPVASRWRSSCLTYLDKVPICILCLPLTLNLSLPCRRALTESDQTVSGTDFFLQSHTTSTSSLVGTTNKKINKWMKRKILAKANQALGSNFNQPHWKASLCKVRAACFPQNTCLIIPTKQLIHLSVHFNKQ